MVDIGGEGRPLPLLQRIFSKSRRERVWPIRGNRGLPARKRCRDSPRQSIRREMEGLGQDPNVVEVFHPAVGAAERNHGLKFFGDDRLGRVSAQPRRRKVEQRGIVNRLEAGLHRIPEADIDDDRNMRAGE